MMVGSVSDSSLELTDGWYSLPCRVAYGTPLHSLITRGLITQVQSYYLCCPAVYCQKNLNRCGFLGYKAADARG